MLMHATVFQLVVLHACSTYKMALLLTPYFSSTKVLTLLFGSLGRVGCEAVAHVVTSEGNGVLFQGAAYAGFKVAKPGVFC
jgi:hypothetical protein